MDRNKQAIEIVAEFLLLGGRQPKECELLTAAQYAYSRGDHMGYEAVELARRYCKKQPQYKADPWVF